MMLFKPSIELLKDNKHYQINNFSTNIFFKDLTRIYKTSRLRYLFSKNLIISKRRKLQIHNFFLPEFAYILTQLPNKTIYNHAYTLLYENTWLKQTKESHPSTINWNKVNRLKYDLKHYQKEYLELYDDLKKRYLLNGHILSFDQGLGKTFTSLALMCGLEKDAVVIVAPNNTLHTTWEKEIKEQYDGKKTCWFPNERSRKSDFYIVNYEAIDKLNYVIGHLNKAKNLGIIVDECHNFRNEKTSRVKNMLEIINETKCNDVLLMSGTPIKAMGTELIPAMNMIDPLYDDTAGKAFKKAFGSNKMIATDIVRNRLGIMMHRKMKHEVINLPEKIEEDVWIKIPNGDDYTEDAVKNKIMQFVDSRKKHYSQNMEMYEQKFNKVMHYLHDEFRRDDDFDKYLIILDEVKRNGYIRSNQQLVEDVAWMNDYEKTILRPSLTRELKYDFDDSKTVIKYLDLKIMGEVIGGLLNKLRVDMCCDMVLNSPLIDIIKGTDRKTICFTSYAEVLEVTYDYLVKNHFTPVCIYGKTTSTFVEDINSFKTDKKINPLIATIKKLSTGETLIEANIVVFLNDPWRSVDKAQASDRIHRIGQDYTVYIVTFKLDTGDKPNLSTRMEEIINWSKSLFNEIVGLESLYTLHDNFKHESIYVGNYKHSYLDDIYDFNQKNIFHSCHFL